MDAINLAEFETAAREILPRPIWDFIVGGAGDETAILATYDCTSD